MKKFDLPLNTEEIEALRPCMKKPMIVHALQINEEFRVQSLEGDYAQGKVGDYLMIGIEGEPYICDKTVFEKSYEFKDDVITKQLGSI